MMVNWASCLTSSIRFVVTFFFNPDFIPIYAVLPKVTSTNIAVDSNSSLFFLTVH